MGPSGKLRREGDAYSYENVVGFRRWSELNDRGSVISNGIRENNKKKKTKRPNTFLSVITLYGDVRPIRNNNRKIKGEKKKRRFGDYLFFVLSTLEVGRARR